MRCARGCETDHGAFPDEVTAQRRCADALAAKLRETKAEIQRMNDEPLAQNAYDAGYEAAEARVAQAAEARVAQLRTAVACLEVIAKRDPQDMCLSCREYGSGGLARAALAALLLPP
jgi:hypothetical protein